MKFENTGVFNFENAIRGMRNSYDSWDKSDSGYEIDDEHDDAFYKIGANDLKLCQNLIKAGSEHRKFLRQIFVSVDITAPLYLWKEFETYKVGTASNSCSTMHKLASTPITKDCFEIDKDMKNMNETFDLYLEHLERLRSLFNATKDKQYWRVLIQMLPESWLQKRTITMNYENVLNMYQQRCAHPHKLTEWSVDFANWVKTLPYAKEFFGAE